MEIETTAPVKALVDHKRMGRFDFELYPQLWARDDCSRVMKKVKWKHVFFHEKNADQIPKDSGIYMFVVAPRHAYLRDHTYIFYVGQTVNLSARYDNYLKERLGEHLEEDREKIVDFLSYFKGFVCFNYYECAPEELDWREDYLVDRIYPWANTKHKKSAKGNLLKGIPT